MVVRKVRLGRSNMEYILGYDCQIFQNMAIRDPRHNSDNIMVLGCLHGAPQSNTCVTLGAERASRYVHPAVGQGHG